MALQMFNVDDANPANAGNVGVTYNGTDTLTSVSNIVAGDLTTNGTLSISGTHNILGDLAVNTDKFTVASATGNTNVGGILAVNTDKLTVNGSTGAMSVKGNMDLTYGWAEFTGNIQANGGIIEAQDGLNTTVATFNDFIQMWYGHSFGSLATAGFAGVATANLTTLYQVWNTTTGNITVEMADGLPGQLKVIGLSDRIAPHNVNIQPTHMAGATTISLNTANSHAFLLFSGGNWRIILVSGGTILP